MNQDMSLHVDITADSAQATAQFDALNTRLAALETAFNRGSTGAQTIARDVEKVGTSTEKAAGSVSKLGAVGKFIEDVGTHYRIAANAASIFGLKSEAAAAKLDGLVRVFDGMKTAVPALLAIGTAVTAIFGAFEEAKSAVSAAAEWQQRMSILGQTVRNQGGDWRNLASAVQEWADVQEKTTQFSRDDAVQALTTLTSTGMKLNDAMIVTRVAEDAAAATGRNLTEVNFALSEAMHGRTQALTQLGIGTKQQIKDGMKFSDVLKTIEKNMGGAAAAAADTYAGKVAQLHNTMQTLQEQIGEKLLPVLTKLAGALVNLINNAESMFSKWESALKNWANQHKNLVEFVQGVLEGLGGTFRGVFDLIAGTLNGFIHALGDVVDFIANVFQGNWRGAWTDIKNFLHDAVLGPMEDAFGTWGTNIITIAERVAQATGNVLGHIAKAWFDAAHGVWGMVGTDMSGALSGYGNVTAGLKWNYRDAFSGLQDLFKPSGSSSNSADIGDLSSGLADEMAGGKIGSGLHHIKKAAHAARQSVQKLQKALEDLYAIGNPFGRLLRNPLASNSATAGLLSHTQSIETSEMGAQINAAMKQQQELQKILQSQQKQWEQYYKTLEQNAQQWTNKTATWIEEMFAHGKKGVNSFEKTFKDMLKSLEEALLKSALFELFMGAQGAKGPSFGSLVAQYMGFGSKGNSGGQMQTNGSGGIIGGLIGTSASSQLASSLPTDSLMSLMFGVGAPSTVGGMGGSSGVGGMLAGASMVSASPNGPGGGTMAGGYGSILANNSGTISAFLGTPAGQAAAGIAIAAGFGDAFAALIHGGNNDGSTYGLWGMIGGALLGIPGAIVGSLFGHKDNPANMPDKYNTQDFGQIVANLTGAGTSGYHSTDPTAPASHNWFGANGQKFYDQYSNVSGDQSMISFIEKTLAQYATPGTTQMGSNTPSWLAPLWNQLVAAFGVSSSGSGQLNFGKNIGQEWITGAQGASNSPTSYSQLGDLMEQFLQNITTQGNTSWSSYTNPTNNGSGFNVSSPFAGAYVVETPGGAPVAVTGQNGLPTFPTNDLSGATPNITTSRTILASGASNGLAAGVGQGINIVVNVAGNVTAEQNLAETIRQRIMDNIVSHKFSNDMALGGVGF